MLKYKPCTYVRAIVTVRGRIHARKGDKSGRRAESWILKLSTDEGLKHIRNNG